jgi:hypothetical protein
LPVSLGERRRHENLTVFPVLSGLQADLPYVLLTDALVANLVTIAEIGAGTVPSLCAANRGESDVLILDGEQLIGAKQNRITNRTIILEAGSETVIPVSCMEQGRWHDVSERFRARPTPRHAPSRVRRKAREVEAEYAGAPSLAAASVLAHAQGAVWNEISDYGASLGVDSATGAMDEMYDRHADTLNEWIRRFPRADEQVGILAFLGSRPLGIDAVGSQSLYSRLHERLLAGYVMDAMAAPSSARRSEREPHPEETDAARFLASAGRASRGRAPTVGKGTYELLTGEVIGAELADVVDSAERLVHLSAFPGAGGGARDESAGVASLASPSRRRGWARGRGMDG